MNFARVLERDRFGRELRWQCSDCGQSFTLGWGSLCNRCIKEEQRHRDLVTALMSGAGKEAVQ